MTYASHPEPPRWDRDQLALQRSEAIDAFISWWKAAGTTAYREHFARSLKEVETLFQRTADLANVSAEALAEGGPGQHEAVRYLAGPPLSEDDLKTIAGVDRPWTAENSASVAGVISSVLDLERFPWLSGTRRSPTPEERKGAQRWTAGLLAAQKAATSRRSESSRRQEQAVDDVMQAPPLGFHKVPPRPVVSLRDIGPGEYCRQSMVGETRADLTVGLRDRILVIECKVSNSEVNSYKRLNHEVGNKAARWRAAFGGQAIPAAVLAGVFSQANLEAAQQAGIAIFWEHDLIPLVSFVADAA